MNDFPDRRQVSLWNRRRDDIFDDVPVDRFDEDGAPIFWRGRDPDWTALERYDEQATSVVRDLHYQKAIEFHSELEEQAPMWLDHKRSRDATADYLEHIVYPYTRNIEYLRLAGKLRDARPMAFWGVDPYEVEAGPLVQWTNRAGLVKLCPSDARADQRRAAGEYTDRILELGEKGYEIRYGVFTMPNAAQWHLKAALDATMKRFRNIIMYGRVDGKIARKVDDPKRRFPDLVGAWTCLETPLSARYAYDRTAAWNVHLNAIIVCRPNERRADRGPEYADYIQAWGAIVNFQEVQQGSRDATEAAIRELIKYPLKTISNKTLEKASSGKTKAPPTIEWPPEYFDEWWQAHKGLRRSRNFGELYHTKRKKREKSEPRAIETLGRILLTAASCDVSRPMPDYMAARDRAAELREWRQAMRDDVSAALARERERLYSIQGNKFAAPPARAGPDPPEKSAPEWLEDYERAEKHNRTPN